MNQIIWIQVLQQQLLLASKMMSNRRPVKPPAQSSTSIFPVLPPMLLDLHLTYHTLAGFACDCPNNIKCQLSSIIPFELKKMKTIFNNASSRHADARKKRQIINRPKQEDAPCKKRTAKKYTVKKKKGTANLRRPGKNTQVL